MKKVMIALMKLPKLNPGPMSLNAEKPPSGIRKPSIGVNMSLTSDDTMAVNVDTIIIPTARSITFPLDINSLNSLSIFFVCASCVCIVRICSIARNNVSSDFNYPVFVTFFDYELKPVKVHFIAFLRQPFKVFDNETSD